VTLPGGGFAGKQAVKDSSHDRLTFVRDSVVLLTKALAQGDHIAI